MKPYRLAIIVGSNRRESINRRLAEAMARLLPDTFEVTYPRIDDLPMYNMDLEGERPIEVDRFTKRSMRPTPSPWSCPSTTARFRRC